MNTIAIAIFLIYLASIISLIGLMMTLLIGARYSARHFIALLAVFLCYISSLFVAQFLFTDNPGQAEILIRISLVFAGLILPSLYISLREKITGFRSNILVVLSVVTVIAGLLSAIPGITSLNFVISKEGIGISSASSIYSVLILSVLAGFLVTIIVLHKKQKQLKQKQAQAIKLIKQAFIIALGLNILGAALATYTWSQILTPLSMTLLAIMLYVSVFKHQLFDIRPVVARSIAYILSLLTITTVYALIAFLLIDKFIFDSSNLQFWQIAVFTALAVCLSFTFYPIKQFFSRFSNTVFYRDAYDSQELLNNLNRSLVTTINLEELLNRSSKIVTDTLKIEYCVFAIRRGSKAPLGLVGAHQRDFDEGVLNNLATASNSISGKAIVSDELTAGKQHLKEQMQKAEVALLIKLQGKVQGHTQNPGYILLGQKKSGGLFSSQDIQILEIIADELVIAIQNSLRFEEIQQFNITLQQKIEAATKELRATNAKLKALDAAKDEFISMASHQLRTPLTAIKGYLSMIIDGDTGPVKKSQKEMIQQSFDGAQRMVYLIADLLNVSRMQTGKFVIDAHPANLAEMIVGEMAQLKDQAEAKEIEMNYKKPENFPMLNLDETKVRQVIMNFLDNALYYTPKGGKVDVKLADGKDSVSFEVIDTGVGVPKSVQHNLFTKFYRADNARKMRPDGTGLGLFMAKKVVVAQGGAIIFNSVEGKGSTFGFSFPKNVVQVKPGEKPPQAADVKKTDPLAAPATK